MPKILEKSVKGLQGKGKTLSSAYAIATANLQKHGYLKPGTQKLTEKGRNKK